MSHFRTESYWISGAYFLCFGTPFSNYSSTIASVLFLPFCFCPDIINGTATLRERELTGIKKRK